jgi:hypothetical protein
MSNEFRVNRSVRVTINVTKLLEEIATRSDETITAIDDAYEHARFSGMADRHIIEAALHIVGPAVVAMFEHKPADLYDKALMLVTYTVLAGIATTADDDGSLLESPKPPREGHA